MVALAAPATKALRFRRGRSDIDDMTAPAQHSSIIDGRDKSGRGQDDNGAKSGPMRSIAGDAMTGG